MSPKRFAENFGIRLAVFAVAGFIIWKILQSDKAKDAAGVAAGLANAAPLI